ncbi:MAG: TonB-dependent receptor [Saprospiraceae bacterium]
MIAVTLGGHANNDKTEEQDILITEALEKLSEKHQVFFAYDADLLRGIEVNADLSKYKSLEEAVQSLLKRSGLKYDLIGTKYCVIYKDTKKGTRTKNKLERKFRQIEALKREGSVSLQRSTRINQDKTPLLAVTRGVSDIKNNSRKARVAPASIKGKVTDKLTGEELIGANIFIEGASLGTATDLDGEYVIHNIPVGTYNIRFSYVGYEDLEQIDIQLTSGQTLELNAALGAAIILGQEVVVTAQARGQMAAINQQLTSNTITNIVSSDKIQEVPDVNAAESIGRLPGVSLQRSGGEGNKIVVRGLSPKYTVVEIDGVRMSGIDGDRSVGLSVISSEMLEGIELSKSLTPDKDADAIGGVVNLRLRSAAEGLNYNVLAMGGYNNLETSFSNYKFSGSIGNRFFNNKLGLLINGGSERVIRSADRFSAGYQKNITADKEELYTSSASITERIAVRRRTHGSLMLDFKNDFVDIRFNNFLSRMRNDNEERNNVFRFNDNDFRYSIGDSRPIETILSHSLRSKFDIGTTELNVDVSFSVTTLDNETDRYNFEDDVLEGTSISERDKLFAQPSSLIDDFFDINSGQRSILLDNVRSTSMGEDQTRTLNINYKIPFRLSDKVSGRIQVGGKYNKKERSNDTESRQTYYWGGIGIGRVNTIVNPEFPEFLKRQDVGITNAEGLVGANFLDPDYDYGEILNGRYQLGWSADLDKLRSVHDFLYDKYGNTIHWTQGVPSNQNDFSNTEEMRAGYIMAKIDIGDNIMLLPGVRFEDMRTTYTGNYILEDDFDPDGVRTIEPVTANRQNANWFPSVNMRVKVNEGIDIQAAAYKSASRPDYQFLSPGITSNFNKTRIVSFNPFLRPSLANNFDLGVSFFNNKFGLFTINGFYKEIDDLIYRLPVYQPEYFDRLEDAPESLIASLQAPRALYSEDLFLEAGSSNNNIPINNPNKAYFRGFELSWQTNFWYLPGLLQGLVLDLNYSQIWSATKFPYLDIITTFDDSGIIPIPVETPFYRTRDARMIDQPASLFNARIGWDYKGFSARLSFRYQGETISSLDPVHSLLDARTSDEFRVDFAIKQQINKRLSFSMDLANVNEFLEQSNFYAQDFIMPRTSEFYGFTAQFGLRYNFKSND